MSTKVKPLYRLAFLFLCAGLLCLFTGCSKTGPAGATGAAGPQGAAGAAGAIGAAGANGSQIYSGTGAPASTLGAVGDYYLDIASGLLYGPKTASGWGTGISLMGATGAQGSQGVQGAPGAAGAAGSHIYSGTTAPSSTLGAVGDYYLNTATYMLYGPKTSTGWGVPIDLQGPQGNANVVVDVFSVTNAQFLWNSAFDFQISANSYTEYFTRYDDVAFPALTQGILDSGLVLVYFTPNLSDNTNQWSPLDYSYLDDSGNFYYELAYETNTGTVRLHYFFNQIVASATIPTLSSYDIPTYRFKLVAVSGTLGTVMKRAGIDVKNYTEVSNYLNLENVPVHYSDSNLP